MGQKWTAQDREVHLSVHELLLKEWDPIGVRDVPEAADEYEPYEGVLRQMIKAGARARELRRYLRHIEAEQMGFGRRGLRCWWVRRRVAKQLAALAQL